MSLACNIYMGIIYFVFRKFAKVQFNDRSSAIIDTVISIPILEEGIFRGGIVLARMLDKNYQNDNRKIYLTHMIKIFYYVYSLIIFSFMHINNFNNGDLNSKISISFVMMYYGPPSIFLTYLTQNYSLIRSIILHSFINMNCMLLQK